jgi:uncharacterized membrane protein
MLRLRNTLKDAGRLPESRIRLRGHEVSRIEGLTDAVFGFAITLLVVSLEVPRDFAQLMGTMQGFAAFAGSFAILASIWYSHYRFFRLYGLVDGTIVTLNLVLLFVILFYTYPLKFLCSVLINFLLLHVALGMPLIGEVGITWQDMGTLLVVYGLGFLLVFSIFTLFYLHAYRKREELELDDAEVYHTVTGIGANLICVLVAATSVVTVLVGGPMMAPYAGWMYALIGVLQGIFGWARSRGEQKLGTVSVA